MVPIVELLAAQTAILDENSHAFIPAIGSAFLPDDPRDRFKHGQFVRVPILNGGNQDEMTLYVGYQVALGEHITDESLVSNLSIPYGPHAQDLLIEYGDDNEFRALSAPQKLGRLETDFVPPGVLSQCLMLSSALTLSQFVPIYEYEFTERNGPTQIAPEPFKLGAVHAAELPYLFAHISHNHRLDGPDLSESSSRLSMTMLKLWGAFIQTGTPQIAEAPRWLPFQSRRFVYELNTERLGEINAWQRHHCDFWNHLFPEAF
jgi:para-nitrobenzyl esterase